MRLLILGAFEDELSIILKNFQRAEPVQLGSCRGWKVQYEEHDIVCSLVGIGTNAAAITTTVLCEHFKPDWIIFCGVAGGLKVGQQIGDIVLATKIVDADLLQLPKILQGTPYDKALTDPHTLQPIQTEYMADPCLVPLFDRLTQDRVQSGIVVTSNAFPAPKSVFAEIKSLQCSAIEMESAGLYKAASYYGVPILTIRAISNLLDDAGNDLGTAPDALTTCAHRLADCLQLALQHSSVLQEVVDSKRQQQITTLITKHQLEQHPEGGWYRRTFKSADNVKVQGAFLARYKGEPRAAGSSILYLLPQREFSAWHTVQSDETWFFHEGEPLLLRCINPENGVLDEIVLGTTTGRLQHTVKAGHVFCSESTGRYSLMSCAVTPGFEFSDFNLITEEQFIAQYPQHKNLSRLICQRLVNDAPTTASLVFKQ